MRRPYIFRFAIQLSNTLLFQRCHAITSIQLSNTLLFKDVMLTSFASNCRIITLVINYCNGGFYSTFHIKMYYSVTNMSMKTNRKPCSYCTRALTNASCGFKWLYITAIHLHHTHSSCLLFFNLLNR